MRLTPPARLTALAVLSVLSLLAWSGSAAAPAGATIPATAGTAHRLALGDSVMLGAASRLRSRGYAVNAVESRQVYDGVDALRRLRAAGRLPGLLVVGLGTNGTFTRSECQQIHRITGSRRAVYLLTVRAPRPWSRGNNRVIHGCAARYANTSLIDWRRASASHPGWFYSDGIHLTPRGARAYAHLVARRVG
jgi:hypothetical protein